MLKIKQYSWFITIAAFLMTCGLSYAMNSSTATIDLPFKVVNMTGLWASYGESYRFLNMLQKSGFLRNRLEDFVPLLEKTSGSHYTYRAGDFTRLEGPERSILGIFSAFKKDVYQEELKKLLDMLALEKRRDSKKILIYATCTGASKLLASSQLFMQYRKVIDGIILENPPVDFEKVVYEMSLLPLRYIPFLGKFFSKLISAGFYGFQKQPIDELGKGFPEIPILIIHSRKDTVVSYNHSLDAYKRMPSQGRYLMLCDTGKHGKLLSSKFEKSYEETNEVCKNFLLGYVAQNQTGQAQAALDKLKEYQISNAEVDAEMQEYTRSNNRCNFLGQTVFVAACCAALYYKYH